MIYWYVHVFAVDVIFHKTAKSWDGLWMGWVCLRDNSLMRFPEISINSETQIIMSTLIM